MIGDMNYKPHHTAISVRNLEESLEFYKKLGYQQVHQWDAEDGSLAIVHLKLGESFMEVFAYAQNQDSELANFDYANNLEEIGVKHIALQVDNLHNALQDLREKGLADDKTVIREGRTKVSYLFIQDPDGVWVEIVEDKRGY